MRRWTVLPLLFLAAGCVAPGTVEHVVCPVGPYHVQPFSMTIDYGARTVRTSAIDPEPATLKFTATTVEWSFMLGWVVWHRDTHVIAWDADAERAYLEAMGKPLPQKWHAGKAECEVAPGDHQ